MSEIVRYRCRTCSWTEWAYPESNVICPNCYPEQVSDD